MNVDPWIAFYEFARRSLDSSLDGITDAEALLTPVPGLNSVNWIAGHILAHRDRLHALLELEPAWPAQLSGIDGYRNGAAGASGRSTPPLAALRAELDTSQTAVLTRLRNLDPAVLASPATPTRSVGDQLALFGAHDWYHIGQLALLRRLLGKPSVSG